MSRDYDKYFKHGFDVGEEFDSILFLGNSVPHCSEGQILRLHKLVDACLYMQGALQQPPHAGSEEVAKELEEEYQRDKQAVRNMARDVVMALTGEKIYYEDELEDNTEDDDEIDEMFTDNEDEEIIASSLVSAVDDVVRNPQVQRVLASLKDIVENAKKSIE